MTDNARIVSAYLKIRDARTALKRQFDEEDKKLKAKAERLEAELLKFLNESKIDSANTAAGTFYRQMEITPSGSDWDAFYQWVVKNDGFDFLEKRIKKTAVAQYMEEHDGAPPPGVTVYREYVVRVRRG